MEAILVVGALLLGLAVPWLIGRLVAYQDDREAYLTDPTGFGLALRISGEQGRLVNHEQIIHADGLPHQNPHIDTHEEFRWWPLPRTVTIETRYYPLTIGADGRLPNLAAVQRRVNDFYRRGHDVSIGPMPPHAQRGAVQRENITQRGRGARLSARGRRGR